MLNLTMRQLRYFDALARLKHFGRAAEACAISQPALSEQIKEVESSFGAPLFERGGRQVRVTGLGEALAQKVRAILDSVDELDALAASHQPLRRLRLGVIPTVAPYLLPAILRDLAAASPDLDVQVRETITARLVEELGQGRLDAAVAALPVEGTGLASVALFEEAFLAVRPLAQAGEPAPDLARLAASRLLLLEEGHCLRDQALAVCGLGRVSPREALEASSLSTLVQMVGAGLGVTLIPEIAVAVETGRAPVAVTRLAAPQPTRRVGLIWRKGSPLAEALRGIGDIVRRAGEAARLDSGARLGEDAA